MSEPSASTCPNCGSIEVTAERSGFFVVRRMCKACGAAWKPSPISVWAGILLLMLGVGGLLCGGCGLIVGSLSQSVLVGVGGGIVAVGGLAIIVATLERMGERKKRPGFAVLPPEPKGPQDSGNGPPDKIR